MKKHLLIIFAGLPLVTFAQTSGEVDTFFGYVALVVILFLAWIASRRLFLWYFKIKDIVEYQNKQIKLNEDTNEKLDQIIALLDVRAKSE